MACTDQAVMTDTTPVTCHHTSSNISTIRFDPDIPCCFPNPSSGIPFYDNVSLPGVYKFELFLLNEKMNNKRKDHLSRCNETLSSIHQFRIACSYLHHTERSNFIRCKRKQQVQSTSSNDSDETMVISADNDNRNDISFLCSSRDRNITNNNTDETVSTKRKDRNDMDQQKSVCHTLLPPGERSRMGVIFSGHVCFLCGADKTPQWRSDSSGKVLCNACGIKANRLCMKETRFNQQTEKNKQRQLRKAKDQQQKRKARDETTATIHWEFRNKKSPSSGS